MKGFSLLLVLVALVQWSSGYSAYNRDNVHNPDSSSQVIYSSSSSSNNDEQQTLDSTFPTHVRGDIQQNELDDFSQFDQQRLDSSLVDAAFGHGQEQKLDNLSQFSSVKGHGHAVSGLDYDQKQTLDSSLIDAAFGHGQEQTLDNLPKFSTVGGHGYAVNYNQQQTSDSDFPKTVVGHGQQQPLDFELGGANYADSRLNYNQQQISDSDFTPSFVGHHDLPKPISVGGQNFPITHSDNGEHTVFKSVETHYYTTTDSDKDQHTDSNGVPKNYHTGNNNYPNTYFNVVNAVPTTDFGNGQHTTVNGVPSNGVPTTYFGNGQHTTVNGVPSNGVPTTHFVNGHQTIVNGVPSNGVPTTYFGNGQPTTVNRVPSNGVPITYFGNDHETTTNKVPSNYYPGNNNYPTNGLDNLQNKFNLNKPIIHLPESSSTTTVRRYNKTVLTIGDNTVVTGSENNQQWVNGNLVYNSNRPFGNHNDLPNQDYEKLKTLIAQYGLTPEEFQIALVYNQQKLQELANEYNVPTTVAEEMLQRAIKKLENENLFNLDGSESPKREQDEWRKNVFNMLKKHPFTSEDFKKWALKDFSKKPNFDNTMEIEKEEELLKALGLLKPDVSQSKWQQKLLTELEDITQCQSVDELQKRLDERRDLFDNLSKEYKIPLTEIDSWTKKYLARLLDDGQLKINNLTPWKIDAQNLLYNILKQHPECSLEEFENLLKNHRYNIKTIAFQRHMNDDEIANYIRGLHKSLLQQGKLNVESIKLWLKEQERIFGILRQEYETAVENGEKENLIQKYNSNVDKSDYYVEKVIEDLKEKALYEEIEQWKQLQINILDNSVSQMNSEFKKWQQLQENNYEKLVAENNLIRKQFEDGIVTNDERFKTLIINYNKQVQENLDNFRVQLAVLKNTDFLKDLKRNLNVWEQRERNRHDHTNLHYVEFLATIYTDKLHELYDNYKTQVSDTEKWFNQQLRNVKQNSLDTEGLDSWTQSQVSEIENVLNSNEAKLEQLLRNLNNYRTEVDDLLEKIQYHVTETTNWINNEAISLQKLGLSIIKNELHNLPKVQRIVYSKNVDKLSLNDLKYKIEKYNNDLAERKKHIDNIKELIDNEHQKSQSAAKLKLSQLNEIQKDLIHKLPTFIRESELQVQDHLNREQQRVREFLERYNVTFDRFQQNINEYQQNLIVLLEELVKRVDAIKQWQQPQISYLDDILNKDDNELIVLLQSHHNRIETLFVNYHGQVIDIDQIIAGDQTYLHNQANKYNVSFEALEKWQRRELECKKRTLQLRNTLEKIKEFIILNGLSVEQFYNQIINNYQIIQYLANKNNMQVKEFKDWLQKQIDNLNNEGFFNHPHKELPEWQKELTELIHTYIKQYHQPTLQDLQLKTYIDITYLNYLAYKYNLEVFVIEEWLKKELDSLQFVGVVKPEKLNEWQQIVINKVIFLLQDDNKLTIEELQHKLLNDPQLVNNHNVYEIKNYIFVICKRLQDLGQLNNWQNVVREHIIDIVLKHNLSIKELREQLEKDLSYLLSLTKHDSVTVKQVKTFIENEIQKLQSLGLLKLETLKDWQIQWRINVINMLKVHDLTIEQFNEWLSQYLHKLQNYGDQHNIEEIKQWIKQEVLRFIVLRSLRPSESLNKWQTELGDYLDKITQQQCDLDELERKLKECDLFLVELSKKYLISVEEIRLWLEKELARRFVEGKLKINNTTAWKVVVEKHVISLLQYKRQWSLEEFEDVLNKDGDFNRMIAFQYNRPVEEIENFIQTLVQHFQHQGKLYIEETTQWQQDHQRLVDLLRPYFKVIVKNNQDTVYRNELENLVRKYIAKVDQNEKDVQQLIEDTKQTDLLDDLKKDQRTALDRLRKNRLEYQSEKQTIEGLLSQNNLHLESFIGSFPKHNHILETLATSYEEELTKLQQYLTGKFNDLTNTNFNDKGETHLNEWWKREEEYLTINGHKSEADAQVLTLKGDIYSKQVHHLVDTYNSQVSKLVERYNRELENLVKQNLVKPDETTNFQALLDNNWLIVSQLQHNLLDDNEKLDKLIQNLNNKDEEIEQLTNHKEELLQKLFLKKIEEELKNWRNVEYERMITSVKQDYLSNKELEQKIHKDYVNLQEHQKRVNEIRKLIKEQATSYVNEIVAELKTFARLQVDSFKIWISTVNEHNSNADRTLNNERAKFEAFLQEYDANIQRFQSSTYQSLEKVRGLTKKFLAEEVALKNAFNGSLVDLDNQINRITESLDSHRRRLENIFKNHHGSVINIEQQLAKDYLYLKALATNNDLPINKFVDWERQQLEVLLKEAQLRIVDEYLKNIIGKYGLTLDDVNTQIVNNPKRLQTLANQCNMPVNEVPELLRDVIDNLKHKGFFNELEHNLPEWHQTERERLQHIVDTTRPSEQDLEFLFKIELDRLVNNKKLPVYEIQDALNKEKLRLEFFELINTEERNPLKTNVKDKIIFLLQNNKLTADDLESKLLNDPQQLDEWSKVYKVNTFEIEELIKRQCDLLKALNLGEIHINNSNGLVNKLPLKEVVRNELYNWLNQQNKPVTTDKVDAYIVHNKYWLQTVAQKYNTNLDTIYIVLQQLISELQSSGLVVKVPSHTTTSISNNDEVIRKLLREYLRDMDSNKHVSFRVEDFAKKNNFNLGTHSQILLQQLINEKVSRHEALSIEDVQSVLNSNGHFTHFEKPQFQLDNFGQQQVLTTNNFGDQKQLLDYLSQPQQKPGYYYEQQQSPVDEYFSQKEYKSEDFDQQQDQSADYIGKPLFELQDFNQQQEPKLYVKSSSSSYKH